MNVEDLNFKKGKFVELSVVGHPSDFYVFDSKRVHPWSARLTSSNGAREYLPQLIEAKKENNRKKFQSIIDKIFLVFGDSS